MRACPKCREENPDRARFCWSCGTALSVAVPDQQEERKVVSILFADLVGFTNRSDSADPEDVRATLRPYFEAVKREVERYGGTVEKYIGDAVMAVYGAPVAHEDDAERAVRAALRITEAIVELNESGGHDLAVRVAVETGETVVVLGARPERGESIVAGDVVNTASRLQGQAPPGGVVVGETTYFATRGVIDYEPLEPVTVKGKADPVPIWRAVAARSRFGIDVEQARGVFVGREFELEVLRTAFARSLQQEGIQLVTVIGEPGVGKSRLLSEFRHWVDDRPEVVTWRQGRCLPYGDGVTFWALAEIVRAHTGILESDSAEAATSKLRASVAAVIAEDTDRSWIETRLAPLAGTAAPGEVGERAELFAAWTRWLEAVADERPLVLVIEDLHWADAPMGEFLEHLVAWPTDVSMLIVCTARPELYESLPGWGGGKRNSSTISLTALSDADTTRLVSSLLSNAVLPAETQTLLLERSGGNPLYAEEFVRMLRDRGLVTARGNLVGEALDQVPPPHGVQAIIAARLDLLPPAQRELLRDAAVVGKVFWSGAVAAISGRPEQEVVREMRALVPKELVRVARRTSVANEHEFVFWHALVREVAYGQIPRGSRSSKHRAAADWIRNVVGDRVREQSELIAYHYEAAYELARASGAREEAEALTDSAARFLLLAGDKVATLDPQEALRFFERASALAAPGTPHRGRVLERKAFVLHFGLGQSGEAERLLREAIAEFQSRGDSLSAGDALACALCEVLGERGRGAEAHSAVERGLELLEPHGPTVELVNALCQLSGGRMFLNDFEGCLQAAEKARELARQIRTSGSLDAPISRDDREPLRRSDLDPDLLASLESTYIPSMKGIARSELGDSDGLDELRQARDAAVARGTGQGLVAAHINLGDFVWLNEGPQAGIAVHSEGIALGERRGLLTPVTWAKAELMWMRYDAGEWDEVLRQSAELLEWSADRSPSQVDIAAATYKALVHAARGSPQGAPPAADYLDRARASITTQLVAPAVASVAFVAASNGDDAAALELVAELEEVTRASASFRAAFLTDVVALLLRVGARDHVESWLAPIRTALTRNRLQVATARAMILEADGDVEGAAENFRAVAHDWTSFGSAPEEAKARLGAGRCLIALGEFQDAIRELQAARAILSALGAKPLLSEADNLLGEATALTS